MKACKTERAPFFFFFFAFFVVVSRKNQTRPPPPATPARGERELLALPWWHRASWFGSPGGWFWLENWGFGVWGAWRAWLRVLLSQGTGGFGTCWGLMAWMPLGHLSAALAFRDVGTVCSESKVDLQKAKRYIRDVPEGGET